MKLNTVALAGVEIGFPVIEEGIYHARIITAEIKANSTQDGNNLVVEVKLLDNPLRLKKDGKEIENKGQLNLTRYISLKPGPKYNPDEKMKELAVAINHPVEADLEETDLKDKLVMVHVKWRDVRTDPKSGKTYQASNELDRFTPIPAEDAFTPPPFG